MRNKQQLFRFRRQYSVGSYILDFYCPTVRLAIELDGGQHGNEDVTQYDAARSVYLQACNITVKRFNNNDVMHELEAVITDILETCHQLESNTRPRPTLPLVRGGG